VSEKTSKLEKMKALVKESSPKKGYEDFFSNTPPVNVFDLKDKKDQTLPSNKSVRTTEHFSSLTSEIVTIDSSQLKENDTNPLKVFQDLNLEEVIPDPLQPRTIFDPEAMEQLKNSVLEIGIQTPIIVRELSQLESDEINKSAQTSEHVSTRIKYQIISGERRYRTAKSLGLSTIPAEVRKNVSLLDGTIWSLTENIQRESLHPLDEARAFKRLIDQGIVKNQAEIAKKLGVSRSRISEKLAILTFPPDVLETLFGQGISTVSPSIILELLRLNHPEHLHSVAKKIVEQQLSTREVRSYIEKFNIQNTVHSSRAKGSFRPIRKTSLGREGTKGFDLLIKFRADRSEDLTIIIDTMKETLVDLEQKKPI